MLSKMFYRQSMVAKTWYNSVVQGLSRALLIAMLFTSAMAWMPLAQAQALSISPTSIDFGNVPVGYSVTRNVTITTYTPVNDNVVITAPTGDFSSCNTYAVANTTVQKNCTVRFSPSGTGTTSSSMTATLSSATGTLQLNGTGTPSYTLSSSVSGNGKIISDIAGAASGIDCGAACSDTYVGGAVVTLTASVLATDTKFTWGGDCAGETGVTCTLTMDAAKSVSATFQDVAVLTVTPGSIDFGEVPRGLSSRKDVTITWNWPQGALTILEENKPTGDFSTSCVSINQTLGTQNCTVTYTPSSAGSASSTMRVDAKSTVNVSLSGTGGVPADALSTSVSGNGKVFSDVAGGGIGIDCGAVCSDVYAAGTVVTLTANPLTADTQLAAWGGACAGETSTSCAVTMDAAKSVSATFQQIVGCPTPSGTDLNSDGVVDSLDLGILMKAWSP